MIHAAMRSCVAGTRHRVRLLTNYGEMSVRFGKTIFTLVIVGMTSAFGATAGGQRTDYPSQPIRLVTLVPPGGVSDVLSRILAEKLPERLGQSVIVENKGGAAGINGTEIVAKAAPDGYTIVNVSSSHAVQRYLYRQVPYHYLKDFEPIILYARSALAYVVHPSLPVHSVADLIAYAKASKTPVPYGTPGVGSAAHLAMESLKQMANIPLQDVPYKGGAPAVQDVLGGHIPGVMLGLSTVAPYVKSRKLRAIFISSAKRHSEFPDIPTLEESGFPGLVKDEWWAILAPAGTPMEIVSRLNAEITHVFTLPDVRERIYKLGVEFTGSTPEGVTKFMKSESAKWGKFIKEANIHPE
jgi:tripartite-type tricarboxylate transporter receptor subunit TctC